MTQHRTRRSIATLALAALAFVVAAGGALPADAAGKTKQARGKFVSFDAEASTITVKEKGKDVVYKVKPEGSVLTRTVVKINGRGATIADLPAGAPVIVYWQKDKTDPKARFARTIDAPNVDEEDQSDFD